MVGAPHLYQGKDVAQFLESIAASDSSLTGAFAGTPGANYHTWDLAHPTCHPRSGCLFKHPALCELAGRIHVFAHNGHLPGIARPQDLAFDRYHPFGIQTPNTLFAPCRNACVVCGAARLLRHRSRGDWEWSLNSSLIFANWGRPTFSMRMVRSCLPMAIDAHNARAAVLRRLVCSACRNNAVWQTSPSIPRACRLCLAFRP